MDIQKAIQKAKEQGLWKARPDKPTSARIEYLSNRKHPLDGYNDSTELDLYEPDKETELEDLWESLETELEARKNGIISISAPGHISDGHNTCNE